MDVGGGSEVLQFDLPEASACGFRHSIIDLNARQLSELSTTYQPHPKGRVRKNRNGFLIKAPELPSLVSLHFVPDHVPSA